MPLFQTSVLAAANNNSVVGDCYTHPNGVLMLGDCVRVMQAMPNGSVDFILTDPPYGVNYRDRTGRSLKGDVHLDWLKPAFKEMFRILATNSFAVSFYGTGRIDEFKAAWEEAGFRDVGHFSFIKEYASNRGKRGYTQRCHENAYLLVKGRPAMLANPLPDVLKFPYSGNRLHPTQKPVQPLQELINCYCKEGGWVFDPFSGSGSTAEAAIHEGRRFAGVDLEPEYFQASCNRLTAIPANLPRPKLVQPTRPLLRSQKVARPRLRVA